MLAQKMDPYEASCLAALQETVVQQRAATLQREAVRLARQRAFLREERRKVRQEEVQIAEEKANLAFVKRGDWWPGEHLRGAGNPSGRLRLRVGGQNFEVAKEALCQDKHSLLFALCQEESPVAASDGNLAETVVVDRDWWLFKFIVVFLRDGLIPEDRGTALQLYREAAFWRLGSLQRAIEEAHLNLTRTDISVEGDKEKGFNVTESAPSEKEQFWKSQKNWWAPEEKKKPKEEKKETSWWEDEPDEAKAIAKLAKDKKEVDDESLKWAADEGLLSATWGYSRR
jgi:hypothetical protein